jgi:small subunit ribosomal protein S7
MRPQLWLFAFSFSLAHSQPCPAVIMLSALRFTHRHPLITITRALSTAVTSHRNPLSALAPGTSTTFAAASPTPPPPILDIPPAEDPLLQFMTNTIMRHGKRKRASRIVSRMLLWVHSLTRAPPLEIVREALLLAAPAVRSMSHTHGGKIVSRPIALSEKQRTRYAVKWILKASDNRSGQTLEERLAREIIATIQGTSSVLAEKERVHTFSMVNRYVLRISSLRYARAYATSGGTQERGFKEVVPQLSFASIDPTAICAKSHIRLLNAFSV